MSLIVFSLVGSAILLAAIAATLYRGRGAGGVLGISLVGLFVFMCLVSIAVALQSLFTALVAAYCWQQRAKPRTVFLGAVGAMAAGYVVAILLTIPVLRERARLREAYPLESLTALLAYERRDDTARPSQAVLPRLSSEVESQLTAFEANRQSSFRAHQLEDLHNRTRDEFVMAQGFGPTRMLAIRKATIQLPAAPPIPLPSAHEYTPEQPPREPLAAAEATPFVTNAELLMMHGRGVEDLFNQERMGYVRDRDHVAGFQSHAFSQSPSISGSGDCGDDHPYEPEAPPLQLVRLELIGLLSHDTPVAYLSRNLPRLDELRRASTRSLNAFEQASLNKLWSAEDVVIREENGRIQMVGSLRAAKDCLECHTAQRGELLGALSYELVPQGTSPARPKPTDVLH